MSVPTKLLIVDDDHKLRMMLKTYLEKSGFLVDAAMDAKAMDKLLQRNHYDLIILDILLPGEDGIEICKRLPQAYPQLPILMLSAKGDDVDRIIGLEIGADDYLAKPFNPRELIARIKSILRRQGRTPAAAPAIAAEKIYFADFCLDLSTRELTKNGEKINLTSGEFSLLKILVKNPKRALTRDQLMSLARDRERDVFDRTIDVQISRLRQMIEANPKKPRYIQTVWSVGYVFIPEEK